MNTASFEDIKPCLVDTGQGFSVLYQNRHIYSRVNPSGVIERIIAQTEIPDHTLVLCFSPVLGYGLPELLQKLPAKSMILGIEHDSVLATFAQQQREKCIGKMPQDSSVFRFLEISSVFLFNSFLTSRSIDISQFKRCISFDMSGGSIFHADFYRNMISFTDTFISRFWKNRIILTQFGRLYCRNLLKNLHFLANSLPFTFASISAPILVCAAGPSLDNTLAQFLSEDTHLLDDFFIIAVDTAAMPLLQRGIIPDAIVVVESQLAIEQAFIGAKNTKIMLFADMTSRPSIPRITMGRVSYFFSEFASLGFIDSLVKKHLLPPLIPGMGSVGLSAIYLALLLRETPSVPVFFTGLDFSYTAGKTHAKETAAYRSMLTHADRFTPIGNPASAFKYGAYSAIGKQGKTYITDPVLALYDTLCIEHFSGAATVFDLGISGLDTGCKTCDPSEVKNIIGTYSPHYRQHNTDISYDDSLKERIARFFEDEKQALEHIIALTQKSLNTDTHEEHILAQLLGLIENREYLYIHFADGHISPEKQLHSNAQRSFLKRIQTECFFFLKDMQDEVGK